MEIGDSHLVSVKGGYYNTVTKEFISSRELVEPEDYELDDTEEKDSP